MTNNLTTRRGLLMVALVTVIMLGAALLAACGAYVVGAL